MKNNEYRQMIRRALAQSMSLEMLQLIQETIQALETLGHDPEEVFRRIIDRARQHKEKQQ